MSLNRNMNAAKRRKNDDFYTQLSDIENELKHYSGHFQGKVVYCNCDDPKASNFFKYFQLKFRTLGLRKLIATSYRNRNPDIFSRYDAETSVGIVIAERERMATCLKSRCSGWPATAISAARNASNC